MAQKPKDAEKMPGLKKADPARRFKEREITETINGNSYHVQTLGSDDKNNAFIVVLKNGREFDRCCIEEGVTGIIDDVVVVINLGGARFNGTALGNPKLYIGYAMPVD